jgi:hypothetical protein
VKKRLDERFATAAASFGDGGESSRSHGEEIAQPARGSTPAAAGTGRPAPRPAQRRRESLGSGAAAEIADVGGRVALEQGPSLRGLRLDLEHRHGLTAAVEAVAPMRHDDRAAMLAPVVVAGRHPELRIQRQGDLDRVMRMTVDETGVAADPGGCRRSRAGPGRCRRSGAATLPLSLRSSARAQPRTRLAESFKSETGWLTASEQRRRCG